VVINLAEALLGTRVKLEGHPAYEEGLFVEIPPASFTDDVYAITGMGMPVKNSTNSYGDLYLRIKMTVKMSERKEIAGKLLESVQETFGSLKRVVEVPEDAEIQKELFLSRLPV
jgi:DnaJ-class molecular chaperone